MQCISPLKAAYGRDLTSIVYSPRKATKELDPFKFECRKCLPCRLNQAREKAVRCWHESKTVDDSIFLTLTYEDEKLESPRLIYSHIQKFMKDLRNDIQYNDPQRKIRAMVTGEYGEENKRPHWHLIIFNYRPQDQPSKPLRTTVLGDRIYRSPLIESIWSRGNTEYGEVTLDSASYVARYAAKKLVHGRDQDHDYHPIHKTPHGRGLGRKWIEQNWEHTFQNGFVVLPNGSPTRIPRYYVDWAKKQMPDLWLYYVTEVRPKVIIKAQEQEAKELEIYLKNREGNAFAKTRNKVKLTILESKFKKLQEQLKL